ncbi:hypothetical protein GYMLUDRAFT_934263 [Collybiopsis luxurians FD-317 M1]|nr:hypothetical protein GYMLUDRAFT_934263 [Collybiopsis luxurians FD-317 M1]
MLPFQPSQPGPGTSNKLDSPVVWTSNSRTTYVPYPVVWNEFYVSSIEDLESYSFGQPHDPEFLAATSAGERWRIVKREGDETSSSSSDDNRSSLRVLTPRARAVSLDTLTSASLSFIQATALTSSAGRLDNRSHPSQIQNNWGNDPDVEHRRPSEFEDAAVETRSQISIRSRYSHDTGYDASSSCRDSHCSWDSRYQPYLSSFSTSEEVSISSTRQSEYSENDLSENSPTNYRGQSSEEISISSTRRSSSVSSFRYDTPSFLQEAEVCF